MKNIAGNDSSIFLFRFELRGGGIDVVLNEAIAADMYHDVDEKIKPLVHACGETLLRYKRLSKSDTIMDGHILVTGEFEVMLSKGLGQHFAPDEKERLFQDAKKVADLLMTVMDRRTHELKNGNQRHQPALEHQPDHETVRRGLEKLGKTKHRQEKLQWLAEGWRPRPGLRQLRPEDLPRDVSASLGYDHRGKCYVFRHTKFGELGRIVLIQVGEQKTLLQAELYQGQEKPESSAAKKRRQIFEEVVAAVNAGFDGLSRKPAPLDDTMVVE